MRILTVGNPMVDLIVKVDQSLLVSNSLEPGSMTLVDADEAERLRALVVDKVVHIVPGGSAANTAACLASLGAKAAYLGKIGDDQFGRAFSHAMQEVGVYFGGTISQQSPSGHCLAMVTPNGERTMSTHLGACAEFGLSDVDSVLVAASGLIFIEGYLFDSEGSSTAVIDIVQRARYQGSKIALTLSDTGCVKRNRGKIAEMMNCGYFDVVIGNEREITEFLRVNAFDRSLEGRSYPTTIVSTLGEHGAAALSRNGKFIHEAANAVECVVDFVGVGDAFAAGLLYGVAHDYDLAESLKLGNRCAADIVQTKGARPHSSLGDLVHSQEMALSH